MKGIKLNSTTLKSFAKSAGKFIEKNAPAILAGLGVAGMIGAVVSAASAGGEVKEALEKAEIKKNVLKSEWQQAMTALRSSRLRGRRRALSTRSTTGRPCSWRWYLRRRRVVLYTAAIAKSKCMRFWQQQLVQTL